MVQLVLTEQADADLAAILIYLAHEAGVATAERYAREFDALFDRLMDFPHLGAPRTELGPNLRIAIVSPYLAFYDYDAAAGMILILRILHGRRNITEELFKR